VGEAENGNDLLYIYQKQQPEFILTEITLRGKSGFDVVKTLNEQKSKTRVVFYTSQQNHYIVHKSKICGVYGYIYKNGNENELINSLCTVAQNIKVFPDISKNEHYLPKEKFYTGFELYEIRNVLTARELQVFIEFGRGLCINDVADILCVSRKTVELHQGNIKEKLLFKNTPELIKIDT
jgi:DNA-binding NarL/FixJ family response regulator